MNILVIGSGAREHAIVWSISRSPQRHNLFCAPGNAGIQRIARGFPIGAEDLAGLLKVAQDVKADLTIVGPEVPLVLGIADLFQENGLKVIGPSKAAAALEGSKSFAKQFMERRRIPTADFIVCDSPEAAVEARKRMFDFPVVVKADGLAAGKGVVIAKNEAEWDRAIAEIMVDRIFGDAGRRIVVERFLQGREASLMLLTDGRDYLLLEPARDYKRVDDGDRGPNTGGMGSYSMPGLLDQTTLSSICRKIVEPALEGMAAEGQPFRGALYVGLMLTAEGPYVVEFNARLGDPETQSVLARLDCDLSEVLYLLARGQIANSNLTFSEAPAVSVVAASGGYPLKFEKGKSIAGLDAAEATPGTLVFHAGTALDENGELVTSGGRVLTVTAKGASAAEARARAYEAIGQLSFAGMHYRKDIAATLLEG